MKYWTSINTGHGFITSDDRGNFNVEGKPCNIWITDDNLAATQWAERNSATPTTKTAAEELWAALPPEPVMPL